MMIGGGMEGIVLGRLVVGTPFFYNVIDWFGGCNGVPAKDVMAYYFYGCCTYDYDDDEIVGLLGFVGCCWRLEVVGVCGGLSSCFVCFWGGRCILNSGE